VRAFSIWDWVAHIHVSAAPRDRDRKGQRHPCCYAEGMFAELAWLPFLVALVVAFGAGVAFARLNQSPLPTEGQLRCSGVFGLGRREGWDVAVSAALVGLLLLSVFVWFVAIALAPR